MPKRAVRRWHISRYNSSTWKVWTTGNRSASGLEIQIELSDVWWKVVSGARNEGKGSRLLTKSWTRGPTTARRKPQQPKVEIVRRAEKRPIVAEKLCYVIEKRGTPSSCPSTPWRALREGELPRSSSDFKLEERCSWSRRAPLPRPRPAPRCLKFVCFSTGGEANCGFWNRLNTFLGEGLKWWKYVLEPNFVHYYFLLQLDSFPIHHSF